MYIHNNFINVHIGTQRSSKLHGRSMYYTQHTMKLNIATQVEHSVTHEEVTAQIITHNMGDVYFVNN